MSDLIKEIVRYVGKHSERESILLSPDPAWIMCDPHGLLKLIEKSGQLTAEEIDYLLKEVNP